MRLWRMARLVLPAVLMSLCIMAPGVLHGATPRPVRHHEKAKSVSRRHVVRRHPAHHVEKKRSTRHAVASRRAHHRYRRRRRVYRYRYHRYRVPAHPSSDRIDQIQQALARAGFYQGDPSGRWDSSTVNAMKSFQQAHGITPTGKIDATTLQQLGLGSNVAGLAPPRPQVAASGSGPSE